jgi:hypothetical protein
MAWFVSVMEATARPGDDDSGRLMIDSLFGFPLLEIARKGP